MHSSCSLSSRKKILLCASTNWVNIGSIGHAPGTLAMLEKYIPEADIAVWPSHPLTKPIFKILYSRFPKITVVNGRISQDGEKISDPSLAKAIEEADFVLHGSAGSFSSSGKLAAVHQRTGKPYGIYGITQTSLTDIPVLRNAKFAYFRDSVSVNVMRRVLGDSTKVDFAPDTAFAVDLRDDPSADQFLRQHNLETGKFICVIPRYRITPGWKISGQPRPSGPAQKRDWQYSTSMKEHDHKPLREAICSIVQNTDLKILLVPEDKSQIALGKEMLLDPLPPAVRRRVVWRDRFWLTDEAVSTFIRSAGLFGLEMHCPVMCIGNRIPAIVCRFREQTSKGFMWNDIGLSDWLFDMDDQAVHSRIPAAVMELCINREEAHKKATFARAYVRETMKQRIDVLRQELGLTTIAGH